jgi:hypothetical protein
MKKRKILGVRCEVIGEGMFSSEALVNISGNKSDAEQSVGIKGYCVMRDAIKKTKEGISYVSARIFNRIGENYLCWISADSNVQIVRAKESQLVFA